jgi:DDE superfamily endonuclease
VWAHVQVLVAGALLTPAHRTVAAALRVMGLAQAKQFHRYHRVLSHARWSGLAISRTLLRLLIAAFAPDGPLVFGVDETLECRRGAKIKAKASTATRSAPVMRTSSRPAGRAGSA